MNKNEFVAGRKVMNCCADDIQLFGFIVNDDLGMNIEDDSWIKLTATCHAEFNEEYQEEEIILYPVKIEKIEPLDDEVLDLR